MKKNKQKHEVFIVDFNSLLYLDNFLISSVTSVIAIRTYLAVTGYPQIGGDALHIAHMLWGGLLMMVTLIALLAFINKHAKIIGSIIGGIGFGIFIDELGKFITHDNNYFFQPTFAFVYLLFLAIYFSFRKIFQIIEKDEKEFIMNALELLKEAVFYDLDQNEKQKLKEYLQNSDQGHPLVKHMEIMLKHLEANPVEPAKLWQRIQQKLKEGYKNTIKSRHFAKILFIILLVGSFGNIYLTIINLLNFKFSLWEIGLTVSVFVSTLFTIMGILKIAEGHSKLAYAYLLRATMISILFVQFFAFYFHQLTALIPLFTAFITYLGIQSLIEEKKT